MVAPLMSDKIPPHFLRRFFGILEPNLPPIADPVVTESVPVGTVADFETEALQLAWRTLEAKRDGRAMLSRADIDPGELRQVLPNVGLIEVHGEPPRFRVRLAGTGWRTDLGFEPTGMWLEDWPHVTQRRLLTASCIAVLEQRQALRTRRQSVIDGTTLFYEAVIVPLSPDGGTITMLLTISAPWRSETVPIQAPVQRQS